ncbi:Origin recognition complex, subunit 1, partial [Teratosphaeriaceae sp. CCFEE 6253]
MPPKRKRTKLEEARHYLSGGGVLREDSDDELGLDDHPWEWHRDEHDDTHILGARMGRFECRVGDIVLLKAPASGEAWVAIIWNFSEGEEDGEHGEGVREKQAGILWFSSEKEIRSKKKRTDFLPGELYITSTLDNNALTTINGKAVILSEEAFAKRYPSGKIPRNSADHGK